MKDAANKTVKVEATMTLHVTIGSHQRIRVTQEQAEDLYAQLGALLHAPQRIVINGAKSPALPPTVPRDWMPDEERQLRVLNRAGRPVENIAKSLSRSVDECRQKLGEPETKMVNA